MTSKVYFKSLSLWYGMLCCLHSVSVSSSSAATMTLSTLSLFVCANLSKKHDVVILIARTRHTRIKMNLPVEHEFVEPVRHEGCEDDLIGG